MSELYEVMLNSRSIFESLTDEQKMFVSFMVTLSLFVFGFGPIIASWIIRLSKRIIKFGYYFGYYLLKRKDDKNETTNR